MKEPLTYKRTTLVDLLKTKLQENEDAREAEREAQVSRIQDVATELEGAINAHPQFVIFLANAVRNGLGLDPSDAGFADSLAQHYEPGDAQPARDPDAALKKLIRAYESASDEDVKVSISDDAYSYL